ncbi:MAG: diguanylate cyclase [Longimicrobiales bacterium]|nr:diguanylate cyclase [Longimicrobiales bacterium]
MAPVQATHPHASSLADRYRVLLEVGRTLTGTLGLEDLYRAIYRETRRVLEADGFYISLYDPARDLATIVFFADRGREERVEVTYQGSESAVIRTGEALLIQDRLAQRSLMLLGEQEEVMRSAIAAPLRWKGRVVGAISTQSYRPGAYSEADVELVQGVADMAAVAVENAFHVEALERRTAEARRIEEIGRAMAASLDTQDVLARVIDAVVTLLPGDGATVWMLDPAPVARVHASGGAITLPEGLEWDLTGRFYDTLVRDRTYTRVRDLSAEGVVPPHLREHLPYGSGLACPLAVSSSVVGILAAGSARTDAFSEEDGEILQRLASQASVALENARLHQSLQSLSLTDPLTSLPNRRHLSVHLDHEMAAARRGRDLLAVIFDLENFKGYNDSLGHLAGDEALRAFAHILSEENRAMNLVARYGGDEFVSILSDTDLEGGEQYVSRIRRRMASDPLLGRSGISTAWGIAAFDPTMKRGDDLIRAADANLYTRKGSGSTRE